MDKTLQQRIAALRTALASGDPKNIDGIVDGIGQGQAKIQPAVEKIMGKMEARDGIGKYHVNQAALKNAIAVLKQAFGPPGAAPAPAAAPPAQLTPMDAGMGETAPMEAVDAGVPALAPVEQLEDEVQSFGDPALEALVHIIEMLIKKDMGGEEPAPAGVEVGLAGGAPAGPPPDFGGGIDDGAAAGGVGEEAPAPPFGGADDAGAPVAEGGESNAPPFGGGGDDSGGGFDDGGGDSAPKAEKSEGGEKKSESKGGDDKKEKSSEPKDDKSEDESDDDGGDDEKKTAEAELFLLNRVIQAKKTELEAMTRVQALLGLPPQQRLQKAAQYRQMAELMESGLQTKTAAKDAQIKQALLTVLSALEAGENDESYEMPADPQEREDKAEELKHEGSKDNKKAALLQHIARLRMQKEATVDGKSMATPKEVPTADGTTESQLSGDAKVQYSPNTSDRPLSTIETKKQKLPTDKAHGDEAEMYFGNNQEAHYEIQTEKDSSKGVNNKRVQKDMATNHQSEVPVSPTEGSVSGPGSHQKEKAWETAVSESDKTPTGSRLVGLAGSTITERVSRATKLARLAESKGIIASEDHFDEFVQKYAGYDDDKFIMAAELIEETPTKSGRTAHVKKQAQETVFEDNEAVQDAEEGDGDDAPVPKKAALESAKSKYGDQIKPQGVLSKPISGPIEAFRPPTPSVSNPRFAALAAMDWNSPVTKFYSAEESGELDRRIGFNG